MFKLAGYLIRVAIFSLVVLIVGHAVTWNGKTLSERVKTGMTLVKESNLITGQSLLKKDVEEILPEERQELQKLIKKLQSKI